MAALPEEVLPGACEEFLQRRQENAELRRENAELKQVAGYWKAMHARAVQREARLTEELQTVRGEIRQLRDKLFGRKSEQAGRRDRSNQLEDPQEPAQLVVAGNSPAGRGPAGVTMLICRSSKSSSSCRKTNKDTGGGCGCSSAARWWCSGWTPAAATRCPNGIFRKRPGWC